MKKPLVVSFSMLAACGGTDDTCDPTQPDTICTIAGTGELGYSEDGTRAVDSKLYLPMGTVIGPDGDVWILDFNNYVVRAVDPRGVIRTIIGNGQLGDSPADDVTAIAALDAPLNHMTDMVIRDGYLYLAAWHNSRIKRVQLDTMMLENFAGTGRRTLYTGDGGPALEAALDLPASLAFTASGELAFVDQSNMVIRRIDTAGTVHRLAGSCVIDFEETCAANERPRACPDSNKTACGDLATQCERPCYPAFAGDGGDALEARFAWAYGAIADPAGHIVYDRVGNLYVADTENHRIRRIGTDGIVTTVAGTGEAGFSGDGIATSVQLNRPVDLAITEAGTLYFTDVANDCVRKLDAGIVTTVAGTCGERGFGGDGGSPREALLDRPYAIDLVGDLLYISDSFNHRVRVASLR